MKKKMLPLKKKKKPLKNVYRVNSLKEKADIQLK